MTKLQLDEGRAYLQAKDLEGLRAWHRQHTTFSAEMCFLFVALGAVGGFLFLLWWMLV